LMPLSVLDVSRVTQVMSLTYSFVANSKLYKAVSQDRTRRDNWMMCYPSNVIHMSGDMSSSVEQSHTGSKIFGASRK
jgi:hypothetical protein